MRYLEIRKYTTNPNMKKILGKLQGVVQRRGNPASQVGLAEDLKVGARKPPPRRSRSSKSKRKLMRESEAFTGYRKITMKVRNQLCILHGGKARHDFYAGLAGW
jgi:hypothetical protein